jgi:hypothetical protein
MRLQRCSRFARRARSFKVLMVGCERFDEFEDAIRLMVEGDTVIVVNPRKSVATRQFVNLGGIFVRSIIERLPRMIGPFNLICERYPYTIGRIRGICEKTPCPVWASARAVRTYAMARLRLLAPRGRWILFTESPGLANALLQFILHHRILRQEFGVRIALLTSDKAPPSSYPRLNTRFKVKVQRFSPKESLAAHVSSRRSSL